MSDPRKELNGMVMDCYSHPKGGWSATVHFSKEVPVGTQLARADLEAENKRLREALSDIKHGLEGARVWGGMDWTYNPLHPFKYQPLIAKAAAALKEQP